MEFTACCQCGKEIEGKGIHFRGRSFCGDECCEEFEAEFAEGSEPDAMDLSGDGTAEDLDDDLGYRDGPVEEEDALDDDFDIKPDDF